VRGLLRLRNAPVRIMAGEAGELPGALLEAPALLEAVRMMVDLETLGARLALFLDVDLDQIVRDRLARTVREVAAAEAAEARQGHGRLQMAPLAHLVPPRGRQPAGIEDARLDLPPRADPAERLPDVLRPRPMAALAADPLGHLRRKDLRRTVGVGPGRHVRIRRVAEDALAPHPPCPSGPPACTRRAGADRARRRGSGRDRSAHGPPIPGSSRRPSRRHGPAVRRVPSATGGTSAGRRGASSGAAARIFHG
jgi:hypothetical protein